MSSKHVRRVDQLDAVSLDLELFTLLNAQYRKSFSYFPSSVIANFGPELDIFFRFIFKYLPLEILGSTFGLNIFELKYFDNKTLSIATKNKLRLLAALNILLPWFWDRILRQVILKYCRNDYSHSIVQSSYSLELKFVTLWKILSLFNFCLFLQKAKYPTVTERLLHLRPLHINPQEIKVLQYEGISKELLWHGLDEFLGFTLPLINIYRIKNNLRRYWQSWCYSERVPKYSKRNEDCSVCGIIPNFPHTLGCEHVFCYYCIASMLLADPKFVCIDCNFMALGLDSLKPVPINKPTLTV